jgi:hypothetical protein
MLKRLRGTLTAMFTPSSQVLRLTKLPAFLFVPTTVLFCSYFLRRSFYCLPECGARHSKIDRCEFRTAARNLSTVNIGHTDTGTLIAPPSVHVSGQPATATIHSPNNPSTPVPVIADLMGTNPILASALGGSFNESC